MEETILPTAFPLQVDNGNISYLSEAAKWSKFLAIMGFIFSALMLLIGLLASTALSSVFDRMQNSGYGNIFSLSGALIGGIYIALALVYFLPCLFLFNFASKMQSAIRTNDQVNLNTSFKNLKSFFKFWGILMIIILCIYAIIIIFSIVAGIGLSR